jgi:hypothetical protein
MPAKIKQTDQANLWPGAIILFVTFTLLVSTGIVIFLGVIQQLRYISWERSLRETESSLAAEKELLTLSRKVIELTEAYNQSPNLEILQELEQNLTTRQSIQQNLIQTDPALISQTLLSAENLNQLPETLQKYAETSISTNVRIQSKLGEVSGYHYYDIATDQGIYVLISSGEYPLNSTVSISGHYISPSYIIEE